MSITKQPPRTVKLYGPHGARVNNVPDKSAITPGYLLKLFSDSGIAKYKAHDAADAVFSPTFALEQSMVNRSVDDNYNDGDLIEAYVAQPGDAIWGFIASGQSLVAGDFVSSAGDGTLHKSTTNPVAVSQETKVAANTGLTRVRFEVL